MDYNRDKFEQYAAQMGKKDFELNEFGDYRNPFTQEPWDFWRASRDSFPAAAAPTLQQISDYLDSLDAIQREVVEREARAAARNEPKRFDTVELILRDVCENEPADPSQNDTVCIDISDLKIILDRHVEGSQQAASLLEWAIERWNAEVRNRPLVNVHRRALDDTWRQVIRHCGADDVALLGPKHGDLVAAATTPTVAADAAAPSEDAYVAQRMNQTLAEVYATILGEDARPEDEALNAIERVKKAAQVLRLEVDLYRARHDEAAAQPDERAAFCAQCGMDADPRCACSAGRATRATAPQAKPLTTGYCKEGENHCVCGGDLPRVHEGCGNWVKGNLPDASIAACTLMIKGICMTHPQEQWSRKIEERIRCMLGSQS